MKLDFSEDSEITFQILAFNDVSNVAAPTYSLSSTKAQLTDSMLPPIYCVSVIELLGRDERVCFSRPVIAIVGYQNGLYSMENKDLDIIVVSNDYRQCFQDFKDELRFILKEYGQEDSANLTSDAKELKRIILSYLKK